MTIVQFNGPDDEWDPKNWSQTKKWVILCLVTHGAVVATCASSMYVCSPFGGGVDVIRLRVMDSWRKHFMFRRLWLYLDCRLLCWDWELDLVRSCAGLR
jgi:hypothetical protein